MHERSVLSWIVASDGTSQIRTLKIDWNSMMSLGGFTYLISVETEPKHISTGVRRQNEAKLLKAI